MSRGHLRKKIYLLCACMFVCALGFSPGVYAATSDTASNTAKTSKTASTAKAAKPAKTAKAAAPAKAAVPKGPTVLAAAVPMVGVQKVVSPDMKKIASPDSSKGISSAKSFSEQLKDLDKKKESKPKPVKMKRL